MSGTTESQMPKGADGRLIDARQLRKNYGDLEALAGFDLELSPGQILGLIGPNGCGKTTAIKTLLGLCHRKGGTLNVLGRDPVGQRKAVMQETAYIADTGILPRWMKVDDLIDCFEGLHPSFNRAKFDAALENTEIRRNRKVNVLSKGMNVQLHLALIMAIDSRLLVLDEPTLGLDQIHRQRFYHALVNDYVDDSRGILITTHEVREVAHLLTDVVFMDHGRNVLTLSMTDLPERFVKLTAPEAAAVGARALAPISELATRKGVEFIFRDPDRDALAALGDLSEPDLAELFVAVVGGGR